MVNYALMFFSKVILGVNKYLSVINNIEIRKHFTRLRLSVNSLKIEKGRHQGIPRHNRNMSQMLKQ